MNRVSFDTLQLIFSYLESPVDLLQIARVNKTFYTLSRANQAWHRHRQRLVCVFPELEALFEKYETVRKMDNGKHVHLKRRKKDAQNWVVPKGVWYVFARHLMFRNLTHVLTRKSSRDVVLNCLCRASMRSNSIVDLVHRDHPMQNTRFQRCVCLRNFSFVWILMPKGDANVSIYTERQKIRTIKATVFCHNFNHLVRNTAYTPVYII